MRNNSFFKKIQELLDKKEDLSKRLVFIFSEKEYYKNFPRFNTVLQWYRELGIEICIDHLGAFHSSFIYLRDLEVDIVRFDSSYTKEEHLNGRKEVIKAFSEVAHAKNTLAWVKFIETKKQLDLAKELGVDLFQGKYLSQLQEEVI